MYKPSKPNTKPKACDYLRQYPIVRKIPKHQITLESLSSNGIKSGRPKAQDGQLTMQSAIEDLQWIIAKFNKKKAGVIMPKNSVPFFQPTQENKSPLQIFQGTLE